MWFLNILIWTAIVVVLAWLFNIGVPLAHRKYAQAILKNKAVSSRAFVLTFDDGPSDRLTPAIMDLFEKNNARATFFLMGKNITGREKIVRQIRQRGHEICSHGYDHINYWKVSPFRTLSDIKRGWEAIDNALGQKHNNYTFRPPYGKLNFVCWIYLIARRVPIIYWTDDSGDTGKSSPEKQNINIPITNTNGTVCLAHDFNRSNQEREHTLIESVREALEKATEKGMRIMTISELLNSKN
jgi:peptidoglycan/xylan/chitin deacetylase (PgdA/CDA1 family)